MHATAQKRRTRRPHRHAGQDVPELGFSLAALPALAQPLGAHRGHDLPTRWESVRHALLRRQRADGVPEPPRRVAQRVHF